MPTRPKRRQKTRKNPQFATRDELRSILDVIDKNTARISRLEDLFALEFQQRGEVKTEIELLKRLIQRNDEL
jgi:hypothetical protein